MSESVFAGVQCVQEGERCRCIVDDMTVKVISGPLR